MLVILDICAGYLRPEAPVESPELLDRIAGANLKSTFLCVRAVLSHMKARGCGNIINFSSTVAKHETVRVIWSFWQR